MKRLAQLDNFIFAKRGFWRVREMMFSLAHGEFGENQAFLRVRSSRLALPQWYFVGTHRMRSICVDCFVPKEPNARLCISPYRKQTNDKHHTILKKSEAFPPQFSIFHFQFSTQTLRSNTSQFCEAKHFTQALLALHFDRRPNITYYTARSSPA